MLFLLLLLFCCHPWATLAEPTPLAPDVALPVLTDAAAVQQLALQSQNTLCNLRLEGTVLWASPGRDELLLQTAAGCLPVEVDFRSQPGLAQGQRARLEGGAVAGGGRLRAALVDNDGLHSVLDRAETVVLPAGRHPLQVEWFNGPADYVLDVDYAPPGAQRQHIPDAVLWRTESTPGSAGLRWQQGLDFRAYEGNWGRLPDFTSLGPVKSGTTANFSLGVRSRDVQVGLQWSGYLEVRQAGTYTFWLRSDDGSRLQLGGAPLHVSILETVPLPQPRAVVMGDAVKDGEWVELQGVLGATHHCPSDGTEAELSLGTNRLYVEVSEDSGRVPELFSTVRVRGVARAACPGTGQGTLSRVLVANWKAVETLREPSASFRQPLTNWAEVRKLGADGERALCTVQLRGLVLAASPERDWVVLEDESGAGLIQVAGEHSPLRAGQTIALAGAATVDGSRVRMEPAAIVEHDRVHPPSEKSGSIYLRAGKHPVHLSWFSHGGSNDLAVSYQGPGFPRQKVPATALFHAEPPAAGATPQWALGLSYSCYEGVWTRLPDPGLLLPSQEGVASDFDRRLATRTNGVALEFSGWLEVPRDGLYTFWVRSQDGSRLFVGETALRVEVIGTHAVPAPARVVPCQALRDGQESQWSQVEGTVVFASEQSDGLTLDLSSATGPMRVLVADPAGASVRLLLNSRVRATGLPQLTYTTDGQPVAGVMLTPSRQQLELVQVAAERWNEYPVVPISSLLASNAPADVGAVVHVRGRLHLPGSTGQAEVEENGARLGLETAQALPPVDGMEVEALGQWSRTEQKLLGGCYRVLAAQTNARVKPLPLLTTVEQVKSLSREEAGRGYPVKIRGILTAPLVGGFFMQDSTWAIYVGWDEGTNVTLHAGDYWEVEGQTFAEFAPNVQAHRAVRLGPGVLPVPLRPTWDQLINGSLDTRYVELQGVVTAVEGEALSLLTRAGTIHLELPEAAPGSLRAYENALIRVRGCLMPGRNDQTQEVEFGRVQLLNYSLVVDEPAPADPFAATLKRTADLLMFDSRAGAIHRVKVFGQVVQAHRGEFYLVEGGSGLRFIPKAPVDLRPGDLVEVAGFPFLGGPSPVLREAVARRTGHAALPTAQLLKEDDLLNRQHEANLVRVKARLVNVSLNRSEQVLELQTASRGFVARLDAPNGKRPELLPGSRLELTGVYAGQGRDMTSGRGLDTFELLLNSPADIRVLARPSWWSLQHTLTVVGGMAVVLVAALVWISSLRRQVEERSRELAVAIRRQEHAESQRRLEAERARVARDLHDDLGAALTEIGLLGALAQRLNTAPERVRDHLGHITDKAREMVTTLDEIVWSLNPKHDSVASLSKYFCEYAQQFLQLTAVRCRLEVPEHLPDFPLSSDQRHHLLLAFKEALTNVVRHAHATETHIGIEVKEGVLIVTVSDDGRGLDLSARALGADGLDNLARRLQQLGGSCKVFSQAGQGTRVQMMLPVINPTALGSSPA